MAFTAILNRATQSAGETVTPSVIVDAGAARTVSIRVTPAGAWTVDASALITIAVEKSNDSGATWKEVSRFGFHKGKTVTKGTITARPRIGIPVKEGESFLVRARMALSRSMPIGLDVEA